MKPVVTKLDEAVWQVRLLPQPLSWTHYGRFRVLGTAKN